MNLKMYEILSVVLPAVAMFVLVAHATHEEEKERKRRRLKKLRRKSGK